MPHHPSSFIIPAVLSPRNSAAHPYETIKGGENDLNLLNPDMLTGPKLYASFFRGGSAAVPLMVDGLEISLNYLRYVKPECKNGEILHND